MQLFIYLKMVVFINKEFYENVHKILMSIFKIHKQFKIYTYTLWFTSLTAQWLALMILSRSIQSHIQFKGGPTCFGRRPTRHVTSWSVFKCLSCDKISVSSDKYHKQFKNKIKYTNETIQNSHSPPPQQWP